LHYGLLKYLSEDAGVRERMRRSPQPQLLFNYLGQVGQAQSGTNGFRLLLESAGRTRSPRAHRSHLIDINGSIVRNESGSSLLMKFTYSKNCHRRATIQALAESFLKHLRALIAHCRQEDPVGYTPSDFPESGLDQGELDALLAEISGD
jgi:non-ribosomal peptide synthase protein (TIGR01720 family)